MTVCVYVLSVSFPHLFFSLYKDLFVFSRAVSVLPGPFSSCRERGHSLPAVCGFLCCAGFSCGSQAAGSAGFSICACGLSRCGAWALEHTLRSCGMCSELLPSIFPDEAWSPCLLHGQEDALPPSYQGSLCFFD